MKTLPSTPISQWTGPGWLRPAAALLAVYVSGRAALELYRLVPFSGTLLGKLSWKWGAAYLVFLAGLGLALALLLAWLFQPERLAQTGGRLAARRQQLDRLRLPLALLAALPLPTILLFTPLGDWLAGPHLRLLGLGFTALLIAFLVTDDAATPIRPVELAFGLALAGGVHLALERLSGVRSYPFSLGWSEGNRLYNYSLFIDPERYVIPDATGLRVGARGRNFLWGLPFLIPGASIALLRLWDALLWTLPYLALGLVIAGWTRLTGLKRTALALWVALFLFQGPIYTPLVLSALLVTGVVRPGRLVASLSAAGIAGYYAAASRWTWLPAAAAWAGMIWLADLRVEKDEPWGQTVRRCLPTALVTLAGLVGGFLADDRLFSPAELRTSTSLSQPLLWYRLLPNVNYPEGILLGLLIAAAPVATLLIWLAATRRWPLNWVQALAYAAVSLVFLGGGIVASVKIGGGNNLHNLDMFLVTLAILVGLALKERLRSPLFGTEARRNDFGRSLPGWVQGLLALAVLLPAWNAVRMGRPLELPADETVQTALAQIQARVARGQKRGAVLFIDQRQLLTFGYLEGIDLVPAYEKKFMMDRAMAGNAAYFQDFYRDLAAGRFAMIVTEPLFDNVQSMESGFREENNAWVTWVTRPLLCFYAPVETYAEVRTQILVPRTDPQGCEAYLR